MPQHGRFDTARFLTLCSLLLGLVASGCISPFTSKDADEDLPSHDWDKIRLVGDLTSPGGLNIAKIQGVTLATQLRGTGSDPPPSPAREMLLNEMRVRDVEQPQQWLKSLNTGLVSIEANIPPGTRKGDTIDVRVIVPPETDTTSLEHGYVPTTRMSVMAVLGGRARKGNDIALASGPIVLDSVIEGNENPVNQLRGYVLGGAIMLEERPLGLGLIEGHASIAASANVGTAINNRFFMFRDGKKQGVATPKTDKFVALDVHPRYEACVDRYMRVIRFIPLSPSTSFRRRHLAECETELLSESTAQVGALKLEAMGKEAIPSLKKGLGSDNELVRFCAAESLAFLNQPESIEPLAEAARTNNGFRYRALIALGSYDDLDVIDALEGLLHAESAEARYGAFDQLKKRSSQLPAIAGELMEENGVHLHFIRSTTSPLVHFRLKDRAEITIFGNDVRVEGNVGYIGPEGLTIRTDGHRQLKVMRFKAGGDEIQQTCSTELKEVIKALTAVDCDYGEIVRTVFALRKEGYLAARVEVNAMPRPDRGYVRSEDQPSESSESVETETENFSQSAESTQTEDSSEVTTYADGDDTLIPTFD